MADVKFEVARVSISTAAAGNTQDITISGFGTPKAAIFIGSEGSSAGGTFGIGWTDGTREFVFSVCAEDNRSTSDTHRMTQADACYRLPQPASGNNLQGEWSFNSWITDGVRVDIDDAWNAGQEVTVILIGGTDVTSAYCNWINMSTSTSIDVTAPGFEPDLVFLTSVCANYDPGPTRVNTQAMLSFGACINDGADTQRMAGFSNVDAQATTDLHTYISNTQAMAQPWTSLTWTATVGSFDANGFTISPNVSTGSDRMAYLALEFANSPDIDLFDMQWPTSGNYAETTPGFEPSFGLIASLFGPSSRNTHTASGGYGFGITAFDDTTIGTAGMSGQHGQGTSNENGWDSSNLTLHDDAGNTEVAASSYAFDSSGWDFTLTTNPASALLGWGLAIGPATGGGSITGTGALTAQDSAIAGTGEITRTGTGALSAQDSAIAGTGEVSKTGTGALASQASAIAGSGTITRTGTGALAADDSTIAGTGEISKTGTGALTSQNSALAGTGTVEGTISGTGALASQASSIAGTGERTITGTGALTAQASEIDGTGTAGASHIGTGDLDAQAASIDGTGEVSRVGTGALAAQSAAMAGAGVISRVATGALEAQAATIAGTGTRTVVGTGALAAQAASIYGAETPQNYATHEFQLKITREITFTLATTRENSRALAITRAWP